MRYCCCLLALSLLGCASSPRTRHLLVTPYVPRNVFASPPVLPAAWKRVAVLPVGVSGQDPLSAEAPQILEPIWLAELRQQARFEIVPVNSADLRVWSGSSVWQAAKELPPRFLEQLRLKTGCDAVIFCEISSFRAYPPLRVGWTARLVDAQSARICWAVDEVFDAGNPAVMAAAEAYARQNMSPSSGSPDGPSLLRSPRRFGQYTAWAVASTLPARNSPKVIPKTAEEHGTKN